MTLEEYLETSEENWFLTGKKEYTVHAMMVSKETSFHNELEDVDYTVADDGTTVILKGTAGEMWTSQLSKIMEGYTKPDGSRLRQILLKGTFLLSLSRSRHRIRTMPCLCRDRSL